MNNYEKALEFGHEWLALASDMPPDVNINNIDTRSDLLHKLVDSAYFASKCQDFEKFTRELLKVLIVEHNLGKTDMKKILDCYSNLTHSQLTNGNCKKGLKTFKNIKFFNLNSMDTSDVKEALDSEQSSKVFSILYSGKDYFKIE